MKVKFTAGIVRKIEQKHKQPIANLVGDFTIDGIINIAEFAHFDEKTGKFGADEAQLEAEVDAYLEKGKTIYDLMFDFTEELVKAGFLPKTIDVKTMREALNQSMNTNQLSGATAGKN